MKILIGCEESQAVCIEFRKRGHEAYSCDLQECSGGHPEWHLHGDVIKFIREKNYGHGWDLIILHPPCTHMAVSGNRWYGSSAELHMRQKRIEAIEWTQGLWIEACFTAKSVALENPVGVLELRDINTNQIVKPNYVQPWQFGHGETKKTGFWLYNLNPLESTEIVDGREQKIWKLPPTPDRAKLRSKTYPGIAKAMAEQWSKPALF